MLKVRITFTDDKGGYKELEDIKTTLKDKFDVLSESKVYPGRGASKFSNVYLDVRSK